MAETAPAPSPATRPKLSGFQPLDARIEELTSSQAELLSRIKSLKQEVQKWRSNLEAQGKTVRAELLETKEALGSEVQMLKSDIEEIRSAIQEEKGSVTAALRNSEESNEGTEHRPADPRLKYSRLTMRKWSSKLQCKHEFVVL